MLIVYTEQFGHNYRVASSTEVRRRLIKRWISDRYLVIQRRLPYPQDWRETRHLGGALKALTPQRYKSSPFLKRSVHSLLLTTRSVLNTTPFDRQRCQLDGNHTTPLK